MTATIYSHTATDNEDRLTDNPARETMARFNRARLTHSHSCCHMTQLLIIEMTTTRMIMITTTPKIIILLLLMMTAATTTATSTTTQAL